MSGKKKNRNKVKRTGTGSQGGSAPVLDKTELSLSTETTDISNGNGEHASTEVAEQLTAGDNSQVEVSQSSAQDAESSEANGVSSGTIFSYIASCFSRFFSLYCRIISTYKR
jgi:hypothetical protein